MTTLIRYLERPDLPGGRACIKGLQWVNALPEGTTPKAMWDLCPRGGYLLWLAWRAGVPDMRLIEAVRPAVLRAVREHTPATFDAARLHTEAAILRALPDDITMVDAAEVMKTAEEAAARAWDAAEAAAAWTWGGAAWTTAKVAWVTARMTWIATTAAMRAAAAWMVAAMTATTTTPAMEMAELRRIADEVRAALGSPTWLDGVPSWG